MLRFIETNTNKCALSEIFLSEILKPFSLFYPGCRNLVVDHRVLKRCLFSATIQIQTPTKAEVVLTTFVKRRLIKRTEITTLSVKVRILPRLIKSRMESALQVNNNRKLLEVSNLVDTCREYSYYVFCNMFRCNIIISFLRYNTVLY